jgi:tetratricopeptide (TPR) repeat protein
VSVRGGMVTVVLVALACLASSSLAIADTPPSHWDRARDPRIGEDWDLHFRVSAFLWSSPRESEDERIRKREAAESWLEEGHAESSPDVRLRFDLGEIYEYLKHYVRAVEVLEQALKMEPDHPAATSAWSSLASAYAHLDRSHDELGAYDAFLARTSSVTGRATVLGNRAEAEMRLGHLDESILGYKDAIAVAESISGLRSLFIADVLARWGLAVALDRSGDATAGAREAALAAQLDPGHGGNWPAGSIIGNDFGDDVVVFFVPDYELFYYLGLGMAEHAKQATDPRLATALWRKTEVIWGKYVAGAELWDGQHKDRPDRWLPLARVHLARAQKQRVAAEKRVRAP